MPVITASGYCGKATSSSTLSGAFAREFRGNQHELTLAGFSQRKVASVFNENPDPLPSSHGNSWLFSKRVEENTILIPSTAGQLKQCASVHSQ